MKFLLPVFFKCFNQKNKIKKPTNIDGIICEKIHLKEEDLLMLETITTCMVYGPYRPLNSHVLYKVGENFQKRYLK